MAARTRERTPVKIPSLTAAWWRRIRSERRKQIFIEHLLNVPDIVIGSGNMRINKIRLLPLRSSCLHVLGRGSKVSEDIVCESHVVLCFISYLILSSQGHSKVSFTLQRRKPAQRHCICQGHTAPMALTWDVKSQTSHPLSFSTVRSQLLGTSSSYFGQTTDLSIPASSLFLYPLQWRKCASQYHMDSGS